MLTSVTMVDAGCGERHELIAGRYRVRGKLAQGGHGAVYEAQDARTEKRVAVKLFRSLLVHDTVEDGNLLIEARVAARAGSRHIVDVLDAGTDDATGCAFLVMELLHGKDLERLVRDEGPLQFPEMVEYLRQAASGLECAHAYRDERGYPAPIIHRDLKPANLFLADWHGETLIKIVDFGIAKLCLPGSCVSTDIKGTPAYMAPEQMQRQPVSPATDVWALGLVAFWLLTGRCYWSSGQQAVTDWSAVFEEVLSSSKDPPSVRIRDLGLDVEFPSAFDDWFLRCVERHPWHRFQRAAEAAEELCSLLDSSGERWSSAGQCRWTQRLTPEHSAISAPPPQHRSRTGVRTPRLLAGVGGGALAAIGLSLLGRPGIPGPADTIAAGGPEPSTRQPASQVRSDPASPPSGASNPENDRQSPDAFQRVPRAPGSGGARAGGAKAVTTPHPSPFAVRRQPTARFSCPAAVDGGSPARSEPSEGLPNSPLAPVSSVEPAAGELGLARDPSGRRRRAFRFSWENDPSP